MAVDRQRDCRICHCFYFYVSFWTQLRRRVLWKNL